MIPAPPGLSALYSRDYFRPVLAFDDHGWPMVEGDQGLVPASELHPDYKGYGDYGQGPLMALLPAPGWRVEYINPDDGSKQSEPLIGWGLRAGEQALRPLVYDADSGSAKILPIVVRGLTYRIYHEEERHSDT